MYLRNQDSAQSDLMDKVGKLTKGSTVSIPDENAKDIVITEGKIDIGKTLEKIANSNKKANSQYPGLFKYDDIHPKEVFFKIQVVKAAAGSTAKAGDTNFMALEFLNRRGNAYVTTKDAELLSQKLKTAPKSALANGKGQAEVCADCNRPASLDTRNVKDLSNVRKTIIAAQRLSELAQAKHPYTPLRAETSQAYQGLVGAPKTCESFIKPNGAFGPYGRMAESSIKDHPELMSAGQSLKNICPNFNSFTDAQKTHFWVYAVAAIAAQESNCNAKIANRRNPNAVGLLQMERRAPFWRGLTSMSCLNSQFDPSQNLACGIANLSKNLVQNGLSLYSTTRSNYWASLMDAPSRTITKGIIANYAACGAIPRSTSNSAAQRRAHHVKKYANKHSKRKLEKEA